MKYLEEMSRMTDSRQKEISESGGLNNEEYIKGNIWKKIRQLTDGRMPENSKRTQIDVKTSGNLRFRHSGKRKSVLLCFLYFSSVSEKKEPPAETGGLKN